MSSERPTPFELAVEASYTVLDGDTGQAAVEAIHAIRRAGYVIVHPDDVPDPAPPSNLSDSSHEDNYVQGYDAALTNIFRGFNPWRIDGIEIWDDATGETVAWVDFRGDPMPEPIPQVTAAPVRIIQMPELEQSSRLLYPNHSTVTQCLVPGCGFASVDPWEFVGHSCNS